jgi:hypothetical protein
MTPVIDPANHAHSAVHALEREQPQSRGGRSGIWYSLAYGITLYLTPMPRTRHTSACRPFTPPMDRFVQESPSLSLFALAIL